MNGKWNISNNHIENASTAIEVNGLFPDLDISNNNFINNDKDIDLYVDENSNLIIAGNKSIGCKTTSISINSYNSKIEDIKNYIQNLEEFTIDEKLKLTILINEMKTEKDNPSKLKIILKEIYDFSKSVASDTVANFIIFKMGW